MALTAAYRMESPSARRLRRFVANFLDFYYPEKDSLSVPVPPSPTVITIAELEPCGQGPPAVHEERLTMLMAACSTGAAAAVHQILVAHSEQILAPCCLCWIHADAVARCSVCC
jgi:hypothetical protein